MSVETAGLPEWLEGAEYPEETRGWRTMSFTKFRAEAKEKRVWFMLEFIDDAATRASASVNLFTHPETDGEKTANRISMGLFKQLWTALGLDDASVPAPNPRAIADALNRYEGQAVVDCMCGPDGRGYTQVTRFRAKQSN